MVELHRVLEPGGEILKAAVEPGAEEVEGVVVVPLGEVRHVDLPLDSVVAEELLHAVDQVGLVVEDVVGGVGAGVVVPGYREEWKS